MQGGLYGSIYWVDFIGGIVDGIYWMEIKRGLPGEPIGWIYWADFIARFTG